MSTAIRPAPSWLAVAPWLPAAGAALLALGVLFREEIAAAVQVWNTSTAYGHCWLVLPIVAWLIYERRARIGSIPPAPVLWPALPALAVAAFWLAAAMLGIMEGRQLAFIGFVELLLIAALGSRLWWALSAGFLYLIFLVPFGAFITGALQDFTAGFVAHGLDVLGIPNRVTQFQIEIPEGTFYVAEACAGLRFLIASIAFGVLYAVTMFQSAWRRAAFIAIACIVPVIANGFRGLGIVVLGHVLGSAEAAATDHVLYGWIFFSIVIVALALAGLPFRQDAPARIATPAVRPANVARNAWLGILPVLAAAAAGPAIAAAMAVRAGVAAAPSSVLVTPPDCTLLRSTMDNDALMQDFRCGSTLLAARTQRLARTANPASVTASGLSWAASMVTGVDTDNRLLRIDGPKPVTWRLLLDEDAPHAAATALFINGTPSLGGLRDRMTLALNLLRGGGSYAVSVSAATISDAASGPETLKTFLTAQGDIARRAQE